MASTSHSSHQHRHDHHDWDSPNYVSDWAAGQDQKEKDRQEPFRVLAETIPYDKALPIRILDVGAGYGAVMNAINDALRPLGASSLTEMPFTPARILHALGRV